MEIINVPIVDIAHYESNPRVNDKAVDVVAKSIKEFGFLVPILLDDKNTVVAGHTRIKAALQLGMTQVPSIYVEGLTDVQVKAFRLMDNKSHEYSWWDNDLLKEELEALNDSGFDLDLTGFDDAELNQLIKLNRDEEFDVNKEIEDAKERESEKCKVGEVWQLGEHKLIIGDAVEEEIWQKLLGEERYDFMFTDPPYRLAYTKNKRFKGYVKTKKGFGFRGQKFYLGVEKRGGVPEYDEWLQLANKYQNPKGSNNMVFENWRNTPELWAAMEKYWKMKNMVIWHCAGRTQGFSRKYLFYNKYDIALLAENPPKEINDEFEDAFEEYLEEKGEKLLSTYQVAMFTQKGDSAFNRKKRTATAKVFDHITWNVDNSKQSGQNLIFGTKPIPILISYLKVLSDVGEIIMEPFGGSGSTLIASEILNRKCRLIEIEPLYAEVIINRWEKLTGKQANKIQQTQQK